MTPPAGCTPQSTGERSDLAQDRRLPAWSSRRGSMRGFDVRPRANFATGPEPCGSGPRLRSAGPTYVRRVWLGTGRRPPGQCVTWIARTDQSPKLDVTAPGWHGPVREKHTVRPRGPPPSRMGRESARGGDGGGVGSQTIRGGGDGGGGDDNCSSFFKPSETPECPPRR